MDRLAKSPRGGRAGRERGDGATRPPRNADPRYSEDEDVDFGEEALAEGVADDDDESLLDPLSLPLFSLLLLSLVFPSLLSLLLDDADPFSDSIAFFRDAEG